MARPTVMTEETIEKLESSFALGTTVEQACLYAGIDPGTYYSYLKKNPEYINRIDALRQNVSMHARRNVGEAITGGSVQDSWKYLERRDKDFTEKTESQVTVKDETTSDEYDVDQTSNILELVKNGTATAT